MTTFKNQSSLERANTILGLDTIKKEKIIFVYCPPRVGSTSLVSSLRLSGSHIYKVLHIHDEEMLRIVGKIKDVTVMDIINYNESLGREIFVFDIYRDPIERKMSEFFGKLASFHFNAEINEIENYCMERLSKRFNNIFPYIGKDDHFLEKYVPIFNDIPERFDFSKKVLHIKKNNINFLKIRLRDYENWNNILSPILKINIYPIVDNRRVTLELKDLYTKFKNEYKIPTNLFDIVKNDKSFTYYLSPEEGFNYVKKYKNRLTSECEHFSIEQYNAYTFISSENQKNIDIESDHYFDEGCQCEYCQQIRATTIIRLQKGLPPKQKILHRLCYQKINLEPKLNIPVYVENNSKQYTKTERFDEIIEAKSKAKIETEKILFSHTLKEINAHNQIDCKIEDEEEEKIINEQENEEEMIDKSLDSSILLFKAQKEVLEAENKKHLQIASEIKQKKQDEIKLQIEENNKKREQEMIENERDSQELSYIEKINTLKVKAQQKIQKAVEESIRSKNELKQKKKQEIEQMDFKDTASSLKKKLLQEIFEISGNQNQTVNQANSISAQNLKARESFISNKKLNKAKETSLLSSLNNKDSLNFEFNQMDYMNQPPPIDRKNLIPSESVNSLNSFNSSSSSLLSLTEQPNRNNIQNTNTTMRRVYKRADGSFVYFVKEKDSNIMKMVKADSPFSNNLDQSTS